MKSDLPEIMKQANLDALLITGPTRHNAAMTYFTGSVHVGQADLLVPRGEDPILVFHNPMEREEASSTGLRTKNSDAYKPMELLEKSGGDPLKAIALRYQLMFEEFGISGRVALYGKVEAGPLLTIIRYLEKLLPNVKIVGENNLNSTLIRARATKDEYEIEQIRDIGKSTVEVVSRVAELLKSSPVKGNILQDREGESLTVGKVKNRINLWLAELGAENPHGTIFAPGRDGGIPHNTGQANDPIYTGTPIVFDIYPCQSGGGYFYDFTRTWCVGHAPDEVQQAYEDVLDVYNQVSEAIKPDTLCRIYQDLTCELFEKKGHATIRQNPSLTSGYVHSLAHGVGLEVHEGPYFRSAESNHDMVKKGSVVTIEPGLYYPERGFGIRIEDTVQVRPDGNLEILVDFPKDLVLK
ncbi:MAG: aminopeptidase P family protein [Anaerolineales bacterium]|nr:aminopeptidase P family protein [Anaerolineales bacterium]